MRVLLCAIAAIIIGGPSWAQQQGGQQDRQDNGGAVQFRPGCEWSLCAQKVNGCKPFRGNAGSEQNYDKVAKKVDACNRGRESCEC